MSKVIDMERARAARMKPARILHARVVRGIVLMSVPVGERAHKLVRLTPAQAEALGQTLVQLAASARAEESERP